MENKRRKESGSYKGENRKDRKMQGQTKLIKLM
jgi:hypothetical protein